MSSAEITIIKRDGKRKAFSVEKETKVVAFEEEQA